MNQHSVRIRLNTDEVLKEFITIYFNSKQGQKEVWRLASGGTRPALDYVSVRNLQIPIPPMPIQKEIAKECEIRRNSAKEKKELASKILSDAKEKVEAMLFN